MRRKFRVRGEIVKVKQACQITEIFELHFLNYFKRE